MIFLLQLPKTGGDCVRSPRSCRRKACSGTLSWHPLAAWHLQLSSPLRWQPLLSSLSRPLRCKSCAVRGWWRCFRPEICLCRRNPLWRSQRHPAFPFPPGYGAVPCYTRSHISEWRHLHAAAWDAREYPAASPRPESPHIPPQSCPLRAAAPRKHISCLHNISESLWHGYPPGTGSPRSTSSLHLWYSRLLS